MNVLLSPDVFLFLQTLKILRTSEFLPYVVFVEAPELEVLRTMSRSGFESGLITKQKTVRENEALGTALVSEDSVLVTPQHR